MVNRAAEYWPYGLIGVAIIAAILNIALYAAGVVESFLLSFLVIVVLLFALRFYGTSACCWRRYTKYWVAHQKPLSI